MRRAVGIAEDSGIFVTHFGNNFEEIIVNFSIRKILALAIGVATSSVATAFPDGATKPSAQEIAEHVKDKVFSAALADGSSWRIQYRGAVIYIDVSTGFKAFGEWRTEDGSICTTFRGSNPSCNEVRFQGGSMYLKRASGEVLQYVIR